jgi:hypothetical protein
MTECTQLKSQRASLNPVPKLISLFHPDTLSALAMVT